MSKENINRPERPEFIRLPAPGTPCPWTSLERGKLNKIILPSLENDFNPPVKSVSLRRPGQIKGTRLIHLQSLMDYLYGEMS